MSQNVEVNAVITKPMLAVNVDLNKVKYPVLVTPKLDGIRCLKVDGQCITRTFKPIPNHYIREFIEEALPDGVDGEIICGNFQESSSAVMGREGEPNFVYYIFDYVKDDINKPYSERMGDLAELWGHHAGKPMFNFLLPERVFNDHDLHIYEQKYLMEGYEGVMIRSYDGPYKCGRSTVREGYLLKLKQFEDAEAKIIGFEELMHNDNEATKDAFGRTKRASCKENLKPTGTLGAFIVKDVETGIEFKVGTGFDAVQRKIFWDNQYDYVGKLVKYKHQPSGKKDAPRFPVFIGFRHEEDR